MSDLENEVKVLKEQNNELVQKLQYWKMTAAQRENDKLELMKEVNDLRLKLSRLRSGGAAQVRQLHEALQVASKDAIHYLVQASNAITQSMDTVNTYMRDRQELEASSPRWSTLSGTPASERVNRVPPLLIGGQSIQPVVSLTRTLVNGITTNTVNRSLNQQNRNVTQRAVPIQMLPDVYIPLTRIDAEVITNMETDAGSNSLDDSAENIGLEDSSEEVMEDLENITEINNYEDPERLEVVTEDSELEEDLSPQPVSRARSENPLEGPSWLLDIPNTQPRRTTCRLRVNLEPDSTTELEDSPRAPSPVIVMSRLAVPRVPNERCEFSPTVRRRKRTSTPPTPTTPLHSPRASCMNGRVLKVMVAKMKLEEDMDGGGDVSPPKRSNVVTQQSSNHSPVNAGTSTPPVAGSSHEPRSRERSLKKSLRFDAPSPNGATDTRVIVSEAKSTACGSGDGNNCDTSATDHDTGDANESHDTRDRGNGTRNETLDSRHDTRDSRNDTRDSRNDTRDSRHNTRDRRGVTHNGARDSRATRSDCEDGRETRDSDGSIPGEESRTRRPRKQIIYKEKPLNRKLRR